MVNPFYRLYRVYPVTTHLIGDFLKTTLFHWSKYTRGYSASRQKRVFSNFGSVLIGWRGAVERFLIGSGRDRIVVCVDDVSGIDLGSVQTIGKPQLPVQMEPESAKEKISNSSNDINHEYKRHGPAISLLRPHSIFLM